MKVRLIISKDTLKKLSSLVLTYQLLSNDIEGIPTLFFQSYEELIEIMKIAFEMYEDFKRELIGMYSPI